MIPTLTAATAPFTCPSSHPLHSSSLLQLSSPFVTTSHLFSLLPFQCVHRPLHIDIDIYLVLSPIFLFPHSCGVLVSFGLIVVYHVLLHEHTLLQSSIKIQAALHR